MWLKFTGSFLRTQSPAVRARVAATFRETHARERLYLCVI